MDILAFPATFVSNDRFGAETLPSVGERNPIFVSGDRPDGIKKNPSTCLWWAVRSMLIVLYLNK